MSRRDPELALTTALQKDRERFLSEHPVSRETLAGLEAYAALLVKWQSAINLVGPATLGTLWTRHFLDSLQVADLAPAARSWVDLGSGAGFPGLVIALTLKGRPGASVTLVESNGKKAGFLRTVAQSLDLPVTVVSERIEVAVPGLPACEIVTARALAPLAELLDWTEPLLTKGAIGLFPKGRDLDKEMAYAARYWELDTEAIPSVVVQESWIVRVQSARRRVREDSHD